MISTDTAIEVNPILSLLREWHLLEPERCAAITPAHGFPDMENYRLTFSRGRYDLFASPLPKWAPIELDKAAICWGVKAACAEREWIIDFLIPDKDTSVAVIAGKDAVGHHEINECMAIAVLEAYLNAIKAYEDQ